MKPKFFKELGPHMVGFVVILIILIICIMWNSAANRELRREEMRSRERINSTNIWK